MHISSSILRGLIFFTLTVCLSLNLSAQGGRRYFTGDLTDESAFNKINKVAERATRDLSDLPPVFSLREYTPSPGDQGQNGTCVAWSSSYAARTISYCIQHSVKDKTEINKLIFSPHYIYYHIKQPGDADCTGGAKVEAAMKILTEKGDVLANVNIPECTPAIESNSDKNAKDYSIKAYAALTNTFGRITKNEVIAMRKSLSEKKPIIFSIKCFKSFFDVGKDGMWKQPENDSIVGNHAMCIIGYDNNKAGGSFEIMNSWGKEWGDNGYGWISYEDMKKYGSYALELMDKESYDPKVTRDLGDPKITGSLNFIQTNDFGNIIGDMPVSRYYVDANGNTVTDPNSATFTHYKFSNNYKGGSTFFKIQFMSNAPAFVYILDIDDKKTVSKLFPYDDNISPAINSTNATVIFPLNDPITNKSRRFELNADASVEKICILYSKLPLDYNELEKKINSSPTTPYATIQNLYKNSLIPLKNLQTGNDKISFSSLAKENEIVCLFAELNHQ